MDKARDCMGERVKQTKLYIGTHGRVLCLEMNPD